MTAPDRAGAPLLPQDTAGALLAVRMHELGYAVAALQHAAMGRKRAELLAQGRPEDKALPMAHDYGCEVVIATIDGIVAALHEQREKLLVQGHAAGEETAP